MTMNLPPGSHILEILTINVHTSEAMSLGSKVQIEILESKPFFGDVQLDCEFSKRHG